MFRTPEAGRSAISPKTLNPQTPNPKPLQAQGALLALVLRRAKDLGPRAPIPQTRLHESGGIQ